MTNKTFKGSISILSLLILPAAMALSVPAQYPPGVVQKLKSGPEQSINGVIRVKKAFGVIPRSRGSAEPGSQCGQFYVAVLDPNNRNIPIIVMSTEKGREDADYYTCKFMLGAPANRPLYVIAGMGSPDLLPQMDRSELYITDAWIGGTSNKPRRGYERGFAGKFVTLGTVKATYLKFDMFYAQVDPN